MCKRNRQRHKLLGFVAGVSEHDTLVAGADLIVRVILAVAKLIALVNPHCDIRRLRVH